MQGLRLGTRGSPLALAQARKVAAAIETAQRWPEGYVEIVTVTTTGDKVQDRPLADIGGKALWTKELDKALLAGEVDFCVHSMKDVESERPAEIHIAAVRPRGDVRDRIVGAESIEALKQGATVGTSSPRRKAQLLRLRPDLKIVPIRGNVETRIAKVEAGEVDATLLAAAGLKRLCIETGTSIPTEIILPAPGQAVIGIECRTNDTRCQSVLTSVNNQITYDCVMAERAFTRALGASCASPVAAFCVLEDGDLRMRAQLFSEDGKRAGRGPRHLRLRGDCRRREARPRPARQGARIDRQALRRAMRRLLVLRPEPGASATRAKAREMGLEAVAAPLFAVEALSWEAPDPASFDGLLLTSANAVRHAGDGLSKLRGLPVHAVGEATADAARDAGFDIAAAGDAGVERLLGSIEADLRLLHLCGEDRHEPEGPQEITTIPVYRAKAVDTPDLSAAHGAVALIHSPRAGRRLAELVEDRSNIAVAAISRAAADAVGPGWQSVDVAEQPSDDAVLALAARLCNKPPPQ